MGPGDVIICSSGEAELLSTDTPASGGTFEIVKIMFDPDLPVEAFSLPSEAILTMGHMYAKPSSLRKLRRGGKHHRGWSKQPKSAGNNNPDTEWSWPDIG